MFLPLRSLQRLSLLAALSLGLTAFTAVSPLRADDGVNELTASPIADSVDSRLEQIKQGLLHGDTAIPAPASTDLDVPRVPTVEVLELKTQALKNIIPLRIEPATPVVKPKQAVAINQAVVKPKQAVAINQAVVKVNAISASTSQGLPEQNNPVPASAPTPVEQEVVENPTIGNLGNSRGQSLALAPMAATGQVTTPMLYPLPYMVPVTSGFGWRWNKLHKGIDLGVPSGTPVSAVFSGVVVAAGNVGDGYGKKVIVLHDNGTRTLYAHLQQLLLPPGQRVEAGEIIGLSGSTGNSTGPHLHLEVQVATSTGVWQAVNFSPWLQSAQALISTRKTNQVQSEPSPSFIVSSPLPRHTPEQSIKTVGIGGESTERETLFRQIGVANPKLKRSAVLKSNEIRVAIAVRSPAVQIGSSTPSWILDASGSPLDYIPSGQAFITVPHGNQIQIGNERLPGRFFIQPINNGFVNVNGSWYRGRILVSLDRGKLTVVNWLDMETYTASVVGGESFPSWNSEALKAQAIAARSYALNFRYKPAAQLYDLGNTESHQVYKGTATEFNTTWAAVNATRGQVVIDLQTNSVMLTQYAATQALVDSAHGGYNSMSQSGASEMANQGYSYLQILGRYYRNAAIRVFRSG